MFSVIFVEEPPFDMLDICEDKFYFLVGKFNNSDSQIRHNFCLSISCSSEYYCNLFLFRHLVLFALWRLVYWIRNTFHYITNLARLIAILG